jgi:glutamine amidotransferase
LNVAVLDYEMGNLHSAAKAVALCGGRVTVTNDRAALKRNQILVVPGVGSFGAAMKALKKKKLDDFIREWIDDGRPYLGICLGLQLLFERSEEDPGVEGLSALKGRVVKFRRNDFKRNEGIIPHMGWNAVRLKTKTDRRYFNGIDPDEMFYFVHSFYPKPSDSNIVMTETDYGKKFCSSVQMDALFASQFHLEKSGDAGLKLLSNALERLGALA